MNIHQQLLTLAQESIESGREDYICWALLEATHVLDTPAVRSACRDILHYIDVELGPTVKTLDWYIEMYHQHDLSSHCVWRCRLAWIDKMIEQFSDITQKD